MIGTSKKKEKNSGAGLLADYMAELLSMPANEEEQEQFVANGYKGKEVNHAMLLAQSVLEKAIEKGDVSAFKEVKAILSEEGDKSNELEEMVGTIKRSLNKDLDADINTLKENKKSSKSKSIKKNTNKVSAQEPE